MAFQAAEPLEHGGDLSRARRLFPGAPEPFIDLSTGINPYSYPLPPMMPDLFARLPQPDALDRLALIAAESYGAPSPACIVAAPGTQSLLPLIAALVQPGEAAILSPTYAEHSRAAARAGHRVTETPDPGKLRDADLAVVVNPNNPTGRFLSRADLLAILKPAFRNSDEVQFISPFPERGGSDHRRWSGEGSRAASDPLPASLRPADLPLSGGGDSTLPKTFASQAVWRQERGTTGLLVIDEAFMDVAPSGESLAPEVMRGNIIVLRSFGKFFGLAGLRLGFAIAAPEMAARLRAALGPWAVSGPALAIGAAALADRAWITAMQDRLAQAAHRLDTLLTGAGLDIVGGTALFRLAQSPGATPMFEALGRAGILVRRFAERPEWLRFGLPGDEAAWDRLARALAARSGGDQTDGMMSAR